MTNTANTPIEAFELAYPMRVRELRLRDGSGGDGLHPGGRGLRRTLEVVADDVTVSLLGERRLHPPPGLAGGGDGAPGRAVLRFPDGTHEELPPKATRTVPRGTLVELDTPGGGGWGA
jgi:N-methylhydantoinase B